MIHYHGTPISGTRQEIARFLMGRHALVPFPRQDDMGAVAECCQSFVFDNGAFTVWKQGGELDVPGYIDWCDAWHRHPGFDWALIPDVIDGASEDNDALLDDWPAHIRGVPIYHLHEPLERAERLANTYPVVALGSSGEWPTPGAPRWWRRMEEVMRVICDAEGRPRCRLHGLRMLNPEVFSKLPLASADSTNVAVNCNGARWVGPYTPASSLQRAAVLAERIEMHNSAAVFVDTPQEELFEELTQ